MLEAAERAAAIQICNSHPGPIHLLLTDLTMPGINGRELARRVKCHAAEDERALYVRLYRECHGTQCHIGGGDCPASKALFTLYSENLYSENKDEREALLRFPCARFQSSVASEIPAAGRKRLAQWHYRKHQPFGNVIPGEETIQLNAQLEINLVLPAETAGLSPAAVICHGEVVRTVELEQPIVGPALACDTSSPGHSSGQDNHPRQPTTLFSELSERPPDYLAILSVNPTKKVTAACASPGCDTNSSRQVDA